MDSLSALLAGAVRRARRQKSANALAVFLPLGAAAYFLGASLTRAFGLPVWIPAGLAAAVLGGLIFALLTTRRATQTRTIASLLDEKTGGEERFLTYVSLPDVSLSKSAASDVRTHLRVQTSRKAALFVPKRDLPFRLDRRVPLACAAAILSGLLFGIVSGDEATGRETGGPPATVGIDPPAVDALIRAIEQTAHALTQPASVTRTDQDADATEKGQTGQRKIGEALRDLVQRLESPALTPQQKRRAIEETQKRLNLPVSLPRVLPIDLELLGSDNGQNGQPGKQGDDSLADLNQNLERLKQALSQTSGSEPGTRQTDRNSVAQTESGKAGDPEPKAAGGGIQFDGFPDEPRRERADRTESGSPGQQQTSRTDPESRQAAAVDPGKAGPVPHRQAARSDPTATSPSGANRRNAEQPGPAGETAGRSGGQGDGERYYEPGERTDGFTTKDVGYVKVRIPASASTGSDRPQLADNPDPAVPVTPYSNAPLAEDPQNPNTPQQPIPYEYRAILAQ